MNGVKVGKKAHANALLAVPSSASVILEGLQFEENSLKQFAGTSYASLIENTGVLQRINSRYNQLEQLKSPTDNQIHSLHLISANKYDVLTVQIAKSLNLDELTTCLTSTTFLGKQVYCITVGEDKELYVAQSGNFRLISSTAFLVEDAIKQLEDRSVMQKNPLAKLSKSAKEDDEISLYVNGGKLPLLLPLLLDEEKLKLSSTTKWFNWMRLDIEGKSEQLQLAGHVLADKDQLWSAVTEGKGSGLSQLIAKEVTSMTSFGGRNWSAQWEKVAENVMDSELIYFRDWPSGTNYTVLPKVYSGKPSDNKVLVVSCNNEAQYLSDMEELSSFYAEQLNISTLLNKLFSAGFEDDKQIHHSYINGFVLYSPSEGSINQLKALIEQSAVSEDESVFAEYSLQSEHASSLLHEVIDYDALKKEDVQSWSTSLTEFRARLSPMKDELKIHAVMDFSNGLAPAVAELKADEKKEEPKKIEKSVETKSSNSVLWEKKFDSAILGELHVLQNHRTNQEVVLVQTKDKNVHLLDQTGKQLWETNVNEEILGSVQQVDYYKNGKLQMVFATKSKIHMLDILGRKVANYPISLPKNALAGLTAVHYDSKKNYRFFVPCTDASIYAFEYSGKPLTGWSPNKSAGAVNQPLTYFRHSGKDNLVAVDEKGNISIMNRKGELRTAKIVTNKTIVQPFTWQASKAYLTSVDSNGKEIILYPDGKFKSGKGNVGKVSMHLNQGDKRIQLSTSSNSLLAKM